VRGCSKAVRLDPSSPRYGEGSMLLVIDLVRVRICSKLFLEGRDDLGHCKRAARVGILDMRMYLRLRL
jgi:hypothetical protein